MRKILYCLILSTLASCGITPEDVNEYTGEEAEYVSLPVNVILSSGNLDTSLEFEEVEMPLTVTESYDLVPAQVGAFILDLNGHNPDYLRVEFISDRVEWVGYSTDSVNIYDTEEECKEFEDYCISTVVGEGSSGYFETLEGYAGIQNVYCRYADESYSYIVTATVYDLYVWPYAQISEPTQIEISCEVSE